MPISISKLVLFRGAVGLILLGLADFFVRAEITPRVHGFVPWVALLVWSCTAVLAGVLGKMAWRHRHEGEVQAAVFAVVVTFIILSLVIFSII